VFALSLARRCRHRGQFFRDRPRHVDQTISAVVILLGVGEVIGALLSAFLADRIGKRVVLMAGISWSRSRRALAAVADRSTLGVIAALRGRLASSSPSCRHRRSWSR
jgi:MFS family permease